MPKTEQAKTLTPHQCKQLGGKIEDNKCVIGKKKYPIQRFSLQGLPQGNVSFPVALAIAIGIDFIDFILGILALATIEVSPIISPLGTIYDFFAMAVLTYLVGPEGLIYGWEVLAVTDFGNAADGFVPTATLIVLFHYLRKNWQNKNKEA